MTSRENPYRNSRASRSGAQIPAHANVAAPRGPSTQSSTVGVCSTLSLIDGVVNGKVNLNFSALQYEFINQLVLGATTYTSGVFNAS